MRGVVLRKESPVPDAERPAGIPPVGALLMDVVRGQIGEFRGEQFGRWSLRPVKGGVEWEVDPKDVQPLSDEQRLSLAVGQANARSRGEVL